MALADETSLPMIDWSARASGFDGDDFEQALGIHHLEDPIEGDSDIDAFAAILLHYGAFPQRLVKSISKVHWETKRKNQSRKTNYVGLSINRFAHHHLRRLLYQIASSTSQDIPLVVTDEELELLARIESFITNSQFPSPIALPSVRTINATRVDRFAGGILKFSPPDFLSLAAVKRDPLVKNYAAHVHKALANGSFTEEGERQLLDALREAYLDSEVARKTGRVFEVEGWALKPLQLVPGLGNVIAAADIVVSLAEKWAEREEEDRRWHLIGARMTEVSIEDYLRRVGNK